MKCSLVFSILLLGTVSAFHLENADPHLERPRREEDLGQDLDGVGEQERGLILTQKAMQTQREEVEGSRHRGIFEDEEAVKSDPAALEKDLECPRNENIVHIKGNPGCKSCSYLLVNTPRNFNNAQSICRKCYQGNLVSIHSYSSNNQLQCLARKTNQGRVWIGGVLRGWCLWKRFCWTDKSKWNFGYWAPGQPGHGGGHCVSMCTKGGHWKRASCKIQLPFICSF